MSDLTARLRRKIASAEELQSVVRTMKAMAASSIGQYESSVRALTDYFRTVELGLGACFRRLDPAPSTPVRVREPALDAIVFGSDQGLVGPFNEVVVEHALASLEGEEGLRVWAVGERVHERLVAAGLEVLALYAVPQSVEAIAPLVAELQIESDRRWPEGLPRRTVVFRNRPRSGARYEPVRETLLPLDDRWRRSFAAVPWPGRPLPEVLAGVEVTLPALIREFLFISLFRASAESLASEHSARLVAMERADQNIGDLLRKLERRYHRVRQGAVDAELFDLVAGYEALAVETRGQRSRALHTGASSRSSETPGEGE